MSTKAEMKMRVSKAWVHAREKRAEEGGMSRAAMDAGDTVGAELHARREAYWWGYMDACAQVLEACGPKPKAPRSPKRAA